jgi:hypothetical protein
VLFIHLAAFWSSNLLEIAQEVFGMLRFSAVFAYPLRCFCRTGAKQGYITSRAIVVERVPPPQDIATTFVWATKAQWHNSKRRAPSADKAHHFVYVMKKLAMYALCQKEFWPLTTKRMHKVFPWA